MMMPIACQNLVTIAVNAADMTMLGRLGETSISAASLAGQYINIFQIFCLGAGTGASILAARYWGMKELPSLRRTITIMLRMILIVAGIFAGIALILPGTVMRTYTSDVHIIAEGVQYLKYAVPSFFFYGLAQTSTVILRSIRKVKLPLLISIGAFFLNIIGNYLLIFGKLGLPAMGIAGASLATTIVRVIECILTLGYLLVIDQKIQYRFSHFFMSTKELVPEFFKISFPVLISDGMMAFGNNMVMVIIGHMGEKYVAAYAVAAIVERLCTAWSSGVGHSSSVIVGNTLGEGKKEEAVRQGWAFLGLGIILGLLASFIVLVIRNPMIRLYRLSEETAGIAGEFLTASVFIVIFQAVGSIMTKGVLRGGGDTRVLMIVDNIFLWGISIPIGYVLGIHLGCPAFGVYCFLNIHHFCKSIWSVFRMKKDHWIHKIEAIKG